MKRSKLALSTHVLSCGMILILIAVSLSPRPACSGERKDVQRLTLEEALQVTLEKNKDIQKAKEYRNWVMGRYVEERAAAFPQVVVTAGGYNSRDKSLTAYGNGYPIQQNVRSGELGISQAVFTWGQIGAAVRAAKVGLATAEDQLRLFRQAACRDVAAAYYDILLAKTLHDIARQNLEQKDRHYEEARKKFALGVATDYDVLAGKVDVDNARPGVIRTENQIQYTRERFRFLLGVGDQDVDAQGKLETSLSDFPRYEEAVETAWKKRPELSDLYHRAEIAKELVRIANAGDKPRLDLKGGFGWKNLDVGEELRQSGPNWNVGLFVTYPLFDGLRTRGKVAAAKSDLSSLKIEEAKLRDSIAVQVRDACNAVKEAGEIVKALSGTVTQAERLLFMAEKGYEYGVKTKLDVDDAQLNLIQARGNLAKARRDYLVALIHLEWVKGTLGENGAVQSPMPNAKKE